MPRYIIRAVAGREAYHSHLRLHLPEATWLVDEVPSKEGSAAAMVSALREQGDEGAVHLEDDVVLTREFAAKCETALARAAWYGPPMVVQFFATTVVGVGLKPGGTFISSACFYVPGDLAADLADYMETWDPEPRARSWWYDYAVSHFLRERRLRYWLHEPSLVQHIDGPSSIGHGIRGKAAMTSGSFRDPAWRPDGALA